MERETAGARKRVEDAEAAVQQEQDDMTQAEIAGLTSREPEKTFEEMLVAIGDSLSDLASSDDGEDGDEEDDEDRHDDRQAAPTYKSESGGTILPGWESSAAGERKVYAGFTVQRRGARRAAPDANKSKTRPKTHVSGV